MSDQGQEQEIRYKVVIDRSDVHQAVDEIEQATQKLAGGVSALSSNVLSGAQQVAASAANGPTGFMPGSALAPGLMTAAMYAQQAQPNFAPGAALAQDAYMQQVMQMGPAPMNSFGPSITTPFGDPTVNVFRSAAGASPFQVPLDYLSSYAPPGAPGDPRRGRFVFGTGEGSVWDIARLGLSKSLFGHVANDNLEDRMHRNIERRTQYLGQNLTDIERFALGEFSFGMMGSAAGGAIGTAFGPAGTLAGSIVGGVLGSGVGAAANNTVGRLSRPYEEMADSFTQYTAPFIRGERLGGGLSMKERLKSQRDIGKRVAADNWFTGKEYQDLINIAGESGVFQFTGNQDQALKAIDKLGQSVKALYALGIKSRDMLKTIDMDLGTFGINPGRDPQQVANFHQMVAATAQSAGMSQGRMLDVIAPAAQMYASQGIGMQAGARIAAQNLAFSGEMFRSGRMGAFENAYFGGVEGFGQTLTQATATLYRTPVGQAMLSSLFAPGGQNLQRMLHGETLSVNDIVTGAGGYASNPMRYLGMQALMPKMTQSLGSELQTSMINTLTKTFRDFTGTQDQIDPEQFLGFMVSMGIPENQAMAMYEHIGKAGASANGIRRSSRDQLQMARIEALRGPTIGRKLEKFRERTIDQWANGLMVGMGEFNAGIARSVTEMVTGVHNYDVGADGRSVTENPFAMKSSSIEADAFLRAHGFETNLFGDSMKASLSPVDQKREILARNRERVVGELASNNETARRRFIDVAKEHGIADRDIESYLAMAKGGGLATVPLSTESRTAIQGLAEQVTGKSGKHAEALIAQSPELQAQLVGAARKQGFQEAEVNAYAGSGLVVTAKGGQRSAVSLEAYLGNPQGGYDLNKIDPTKLNSILSHASAPTGMATEDVLKDGVTSNVRDIMKRSSVAYAQAQIAREEMIKSGKFTAQEIDEYLGSRPKETGSLVDMKAGDGSAPSRLGEDGKSFGQSVSELLSGKPKHMLSPERAVAMEAEFKGVLDEYRGMQARNIDLISGIKAFRDDKDQTFSTSAKNLADTVINAHGMDKIRASVSLNPADVEKNFDSFAKLAYGKNRSDLTMREQAMVGAAMSAVSDRMGAADPAGKVLSQITHDVQVATKSDVGASMEDLEKSRKEALGKLNGDIRAALDVSGTERLENTELVKQMSILQMAEEAGTADGKKGDWDAFRYKLQRAGVTDEEMSRLGIDQGKFISDRAGFITNLSAKIERTLGDTSGAQRERLVKAQSKIKQKGFFGLREDTDESMIFAQAKLLGDNAKLQSDMGTISLDQESKDMVLRRLGGKKIGGEEADDLMKMFNERTGANLSGISRFAEALDKDKDAQTKLGISDGYISDIKGAVGDLNRGRSVSADTLQRILQQGGMNQDNAKAMAQQMHTELQKRIDRGDVAGAKDAISSTLRASLVQSVTKGDGYMAMSGKEVTGGIMGSDAMRGMMAAINEQNRIANSLENIAKNFAGNSSETWADQVKDFKESIEGDGGFGKKVDKFGSAVDAFVGAAEKIKQAAKDAPAANVTYRTTIQEAESVPGKGKKR